MTLHSIGCLSHLKTRLFQLLSDMNFLDHLKSYDKDHIPPKVIKVIRDKYTSNPDFVPKLVASVSGAAEGLCSWVTAMDIYDRVAKVSSD